MSGLPKFSVVIPTYNRLDFLKQSVSSVRAQTFTDYEIIVVDDGSTDGTWDWLVVQGSYLRAIRQPNRGPGAARNLGIKQARGDYFVFLDSDDLWFPWTLHVFARAIQEHGCPHIVGGKYVEFNDETKLSDLRQESYDGAWFPDYLASSRYHISVGTHCALRRQNLLALKFLEDRLNAEDHDLILQMGTLPGFVQIVAPVTAAWRRHSASETGDFARSASGVLRLLEREKLGAYPGGAERSRERRRIISRHIRPTALACVQKGELKRGWKLYCSIFTWNVMLGRWKYVLVFPIGALLAFVSRMVTGKPRSV